MISYQQAKDIILHHSSSIAAHTEEIPLVQSNGRILADDVIADTNLPPFNHSAVDGYAIQFSKNISQWKCIGEITAGNYYEHTIDTHSCISIMTGGKIPPDADTIIPIEDVRSEQHNIFLNCDKQIKKGMNVRREGEDISQTDVVAVKGTLISPMHIPVLAACGKSKILVYNKLRIGILSTGDELIEIDEPICDDKIRATNLYALLSAVESENHTAVNLGIVKDSKELLQNRVESALQNENLDILLTTGGVSVGKHDYLLEIFKSVGIEIYFRQVRIKPGKPIVFGTYTSKNKTVLVFGLPGNPVSSFINFYLFVRQVLHQFILANRTTIVTAKLLHNISKHDSKRHFLRGTITYNQTAHYYEVTTQKNQSSGNLAGLAQSNCLVVITEEINSVFKGEWIECILI